MATNQQEQLQKMFQEVETKYYQTQQELQTVRSQIANREREVKLSQNQQSQLQNENVDQVWKGVGKMFMCTPASEYTKSVENEQTQLKESITALGKKQHYLETTLKNTTDAINEMMKHSGK